MSQHPETVEIKVPVTEDNEQGIVVINKSDFVEGEHELATEEGKAGPVKEPESAGDSTPPVEQKTEAASVQQPWAPKA